MSGSWPGLTWGELRARRPDVEEVGRGLVYNVGIGLGFLATVRADGGPRVYPITLTIHRNGLYAFLLPGPKLRDLERDPRYALHTETVPPPNQDDGLYVTGMARVLTEADLRLSAGQQLRSELGAEDLWPEFPTQTLVEFRIQRSLLTLTSPRGGLPAGHTILRLDAEAP